MAFPKMAMNDRRLFEQLTLAVPGVVWICDAQGGVEFSNAHWTEFTGMPQVQAHGHGWLEAIHPTDAAEFKARLPLRSSLHNAQTIVRVRRHDGVHHKHLLSIRHVGGGKWVGCAINAHAWLTAELRDATQGRILEHVAAGTELSQLLAELCDAAERQIAGATCSVVLVDSSRGCFTSGIAPKMPSEIMACVPNTKIGKGVGSCGTAAFERRDVFSIDISTDPHWDSWRSLFAPLGFRTCWSKPVFDSNGEVIATMAFYFRETRKPSALELEELSRLRSLAALAIERARIFEALRESEEHYRHTVEQNPQIPWTADPDGNILSVSSRWADFTTISQAQALGDGWLAALHPDDLERTIDLWQLALSTGQSLDINYRIRTVDGSYRWARARATARRNASGQIVRWYGTLEDVHEQYLANEKMRVHAYHDDLTRLPNRRLFMDELRRRLRGSQGSVGLMILDMDDFKLVNDRYGHLTGDAVLRLFATYLRHATEADAFIARLGGDEFAIICEHIDGEEDLLARAEQIEAELDARLKNNQKTRVCRPSIGCALGRHQENPDELFKKADLALYAAKSGGKGRVKLFHPAISSAASGRAEALDLARTALREGWIKAFYQPIVDLRHQTLAGFEALLRVDHPQKGLLTPIAIRTALDDPRLANSIAMRMAQIVVEDLSSCSRDGLDFGPVSLNLATENLVNTEFLDFLFDLLDSKQLPRGAIKLEITERVLLDELGDSVARNLKAVRESGVGISLDDFGTGYASLAHLRTLPVDEIKIDRSFVTGLGEDTHQREIVQAMLGLAKALRLRTVAEGIETEGEALKLAAWGCDFGQGYLFGRPEPFAIVRAMVVEQCRGYPRLAVAP